MATVTSSTSTSPALQRQSSSSGSGDGTASTSLVIGLSVGLGGAIVVAVVVIIALVIGMHVRRKRDVDSITHPLANYIFNVPYNRPRNGATFSTLSRASVTIIPPALVHSTPWYYGEHDNDLDPVSTDL